MNSNPFRSSIVADPWNSLETDVPQIHAETFNYCREAIEVVRSQRRSTSMLIYGAAGSGKTHLLARLRSHLNKSASVKGPEQFEAVFIAVRMQTGPRMIWRYLQNKFAIDLLQRTNGGPTQLEQLFLHRLIEGGFTKRELYRWMTGKKGLSHSLDDLNREMDEVFEQIDSSQKISRDLQTVLEHLLLGRHRKDASAWLRGEALPESASEMLGVAPIGDEDEDLEFRARQLVEALCSLSGPDVPVVFCFDQVEALQVHAEDKAGLFAFGQMVSTLFSETANTLIISCIQTSLIDLLKQTVRGADRDRLGEFKEVALNPLNWNEASKLISARLNTSAELATLRVMQNDVLWPLREEEIKTVFNQNQCTARKLLVRCAELFDTWYIKGMRGEPGPVITQLPTEDFLDQTLQETLSRSLADNSPEHTDEIVAHGLPMFLHLTGAGSRQTLFSPERDIDFAINKGGERIALSLCNQNTKSLWRRLDRLKILLGEGNLNLTKLVLLRDARLPISKSATGTLRRRDELVSEGARWVTLTAEMMAALDALRKLLSDAKSGDLAQNGETISPSTVEQWLSRNLGARLPQLATLLDEINGDSSASPSQIRLRERLAELLQAHHLISVEDAAHLLQYEPAAVAECARHYPDGLGMLDGSPAILFQLTNEMVNA